MKLLQRNTRKNSEIDSNNVYNNGKDKSYCCTSIFAVVAQQSNIIIIMKIIGMIGLLMLLVLVFVHVTISNRRGYGIGYIFSNESIDHETHPDAANEGKRINVSGTSMAVGEHVYDIKIPYPVLVASLYKSGTTSIHGYFRCGKERSIHYQNLDNGGIRTGPCILENVQNDKPMFDGCGGYSDGIEPDIFADNNVLEPPDICYDPSVYSLDNFYKHYPNGTIILTVRDSYEWVNSVENYAGTLKKLVQCKQLWPQQEEMVGNRPLTKEDVRMFYLWQLDHVREFVKSHPTITYIEVDLVAADTGSILEEKIGIPARCWGNRNQNKQDKEEKVAEIIQQKEGNEKGNEAVEQNQQQVDISQDTATITTSSSSSSGYVLGKDGRMDPKDARELDIKIPYPVLVASLYKSGTTSIHKYFTCARQLSVHYSNHDIRTGPCLMDNAMNDRPLFENCGGYIRGDLKPEIFVDNNVISPPEICYDPSIYSLDNFYKYYPNGTIILTVRDSYQWLDSTERWAGTLKKLLQCNELYPDQYNMIGNKTLEREDVRQFYLWQLDHVRRFVNEHPSITFIEVDLASEQTASILEDRIGIPSECWGDANHNERKPSTVFTTTTQEANRNELEEEEVTEDQQKQNDPNVATTLTAEELDELMNTIPNPPSSPDGIRIPYPVLVASLYKSGTTSVHGYFRCGKQRSIHYQNLDNGGIRSGPCLMDNVMNDKPMFQGCGGYPDGIEPDIFVDNNVLEPPEICYDPSVYSLENFAKYYPNGTIILTVRDVDEWLNSVENYAGTLKKLLQCNELWPEQYNMIGNRSLTREDIRMFYLWQLDHVRLFATTHPSITYIELSLTSNNTASILEQRIGIPARCWGNRNHNEDGDKKEDE